MSDAAVWVLAIVLWAAALGAFWWLAPNKES